MSLIMGKKKKAVLLLKQEEERKQRELQARVSIKRTLNQMKLQSNKLKAFKKTYIEKARGASIVGNQQTYQLAKSGLKMCLGKQKFLDSMIMNFELAMEMNDMNKVIEQFVDGINLISDQMKKITTTVDMAKAQSAFDLAMSNNLSQYEALDTFMTSSVQGFNTMDSFADDISDDEINQLIANQVADTESVIDKEIDAKIEQVREKMGTM